MNEMMVSILSLMAGILLGLVFFGGLWWTVQKASGTKRPAIWYLVSFIARMGIVLGGFYLVSSGHWNRMLFNAAGFMVARSITVVLLAPTREKRINVVNNRPCAQPLTSMCFLAVRSARGQLDRGDHVD